MGCIELFPIILSPFFLFHDRLHSSTEKHKLGLFDVECAEECGQRQGTCSLALLVALSHHPRTC